jgi:hypothetical protein
MTTIFYMFPCFYKQVFGVSCPLCGCQRAIVLLSQGAWVESIKMFPPLFPLAITLLLVLAVRWRKPGAGKKVIRGALVVDAVFLVFNMVYQNIVH